METGERINKEKQIFSSFKMNQNLMIFQFHSFLFTMVQKLRKNKIDDKDFYNKGHID